MKTDAQEFIGMLFLARDIAHSAHLSTDSYSKHKALEGFYKSIVDLADNFAEAYMGRKGEKVAKIPRMNIPDTDIVKALSTILEVLEESRDFIKKDDTPINNIIDEICGEFLSVIYKIKFLK